jgi:hypothetical protein
VGGFDTGGHAGESSLVALGLGVGSQVHAERGSRGG